MYKNEKNAKTQNGNNHHHMRVNQAIIQVWNLIGVFLTQKLRLINKRLRELTTPTRLSAS